GRRRGDPATGDATVGLLVLLWHGRCRRLVGAGRGRAGLGTCLVAGPSPDRAGAAPGQPRPGRGGTITTTHERGSHPRSRTWRRRGGGLRPAFPGSVRRRRRSPRRARHLDVPGHRDVPL